MKILILKDNISVTRMIPKVGMVTLNGDTPQSMYEMLNNNGFSDAFEVYIICDNCLNKDCNCPKSISYKGVENEPKTTKNRTKKTNK